MYALAEQETIDYALSILAHRVNDNPILGRPNDTRAYLKLALARFEHEVFGVIFCDNRNRIIKDERLFRGTIDGAAVYPREVVKEALLCNASAVVLYHNHPSGDGEPSAADRDITKRLTKALKLFDIRVLDHLVVGHTVVSMVERGMV